ncbi:hypothetical protein CHGG_00911 [Chaetomium globosum CBS 148.51]|uniref:PNPLA domain-containing protein n=1 Tax=Chaetomium globosum (strain ATCC 6205 / CBS 148.51 / DSM 1962 / NBRC 6347 / NRRL 1970) TaxID=306901 RepID=Q2HFU3_CHAGB|nr:uncharacterized protein CHGG_00911 [Chaetomium globosum CBS 148.51]EAQ92676.1 hypothetical protein CHGG_00911 [Chaetomium globosum CBS 148.51]
MVQIKESCRLETIPKPCDYFHMIGGTSTGGLIAIMLGRLRMSTEEALREYDECSQKIFSSSNKKWTTATEKYKATALKMVVEDLVRRRNMGEYLRDASLTHDSKGQCFVCVMPAEKIGEPRRLRSFSTHDTDRDGFTVKIWEAARATTAASVYFKPMTVKVGPSAEEFIDAAIGCNNPVIYLLQEAAAHIGKGRRLGCLISIGTGTRVVRIGRASTGMKNVGQALKFVKELIGTLKNTATDGEDAHRQVQEKLGDYTNAYFRFNVPDVADKVGLDKYLQIGTLKVATAAYLAQPLVAAQILNAADGLGRNSSEHGLTLGHAAGIDKDQVILTTHEARSLGDINRFFMARDDILAKLDNCFFLRDTKGKPRREFLLHGMGGVGKTQIALKAADDLEERFTQTRAIPSGTIDEMKDVALEWIGKLSEEWLIIYDNLPDNGRLAPTLPRRNTGNIIYTSRSQGFLADLPAECVYEVNSFSEEDAVELLLKIAGNEKFRTNEEEMKALRASVVEVGGLPLAIEAMGSVLRKGDFTPLTYLQRFRNQQNRPELLSKQNDDGSLPARPALYTALDLSYDALISLRRREGRGVMGTAAHSALTALNLLCFYHNEEIPVSMIERSAEERQRWGSNGVYPLSKLTDDPFMDATNLFTCKYPSKKWDALHFNLGVQILQQFSLVKHSRKRDTVSMHVMVQAWAQDRMAKETRKRLAHAARAILIESIKPGWNRLDQAFLRFLPPHLNACMAHEAESVGYHHQYEAHLDFKLGWYYYQQKQFSLAVDHLQRMLPVWKCNTGGYSQTATFGLSLLANVYHEMGRIGDAEAAYLELIEMLDMRKDDLLGEYMEREERMERTKKDLKRQARYQRAARLLLFKSTDQSITDDRDQILSTPDAEDSVVKRDNALPPVFKTLEQSMEKVDAATAREPKGESLLEWNDEVGRTYAELASMLFDSGRHKDGKEYLRMAIETVKKYADEHDFQVWSWEDELIRRSGGADLPHWLQRYKDLRALPPDIYGKFPGHEYAFVLSVGLGQSYLGAGDLKGAYEVYASELKRAPLLYGPSDPKTLYLMRAMAETASHRGLFEEANQFARKAVELAKVAYGQWHYETARSLNTLAVIMVPQTLDLGQGSEHWNIMKEAYDTVRVAFWEGHPMAKKLKHRLELFAAMEDGNGEASSEATQLSQEIKDRVFAAGTPKSKKEWMEKASVAYGEILSERYRTREKLANPRLRQQQDTNSGLQFLGISDQAVQNTSSIGGEEGEDAEAQRKRKGKGKEITPPSPVSEPDQNVMDGSGSKQFTDITKESIGSERQPDVKGKGKAVWEPTEMSQTVN